MIGKVEPKKREKKMKKAFTMIELVFVIVILGILASVAIPKLVATRDDAEVAAGVQRLSGMLSDIGSYYTAHGTFAEVSKMTREIVMDATKNRYEGNLTTASYFGNTAMTKSCLKIQVDDNNGTLDISDASDGSSYCQALASEASGLIRLHKFGGSAIYGD